MVKAKDIRSIKDNIIKYKAELDKETDLLQKLKLERKLREQQRKLMDVEFQLCNIDIYLYGDSDLYKNIFVDRYILGLTQKQLVYKYDIRITTLYRKLKIAKSVFENNKLKI